MCSTVTVLPVAWRGLLISEQGEMCQEKHKCEGLQAWLVRTGLHSSTTQCGERGVIPEPTRKSGELRDVYRESACSPPGPLVTLSTDVSCRRDRAWALYMLVTLEQRGFSYTAFVSDIQPHFCT